MLRAAAAVGVSAAFGAPIGGILFSIEATANYYATSHYWGAFYARRSGRLLLGSWRSSPTGRSRHILIRSHISTGRSGSSYCYRLCVASWEASS